MTASATRRTGTALGVAADRRTLLAVVTGSGVAFGLTGPLVSVAAVHLGAGPLGAGVAVAVLQVPVLVIGLLGTRWLPRLPLRRTVTTAVLLCAAGAATAAAGTYGLLLVGRVTQGVGVVLLLGTAGFSLVSRDGPGGGGTGFGSFQAAWFAGIATGPLVALAVALAGGDLVHTTFLTASAVAVAVAAAAAVLVRGPRAGGRPRFGLPLRRGPRPPARALLLSGAGQATRSGLAVTVVPLVGVTLALEPGVLILGLTLLGIVDVLAMVVASHLPRAWDRRTAVAAVCGWGVLAVTVIGVATTPTVFLLGCTALGVTVGSTWVLPGALVLDGAPHLEAAFSWYRIACDTGLLLGALVAGGLAVLGPRSALAAWALLLVATAAVALTVPGPRHHRTPSLLHVTVDTTTEEVLP